MEALLGEEELERSAVVANCRMNRERGLLGSNGYTPEIGFVPLDFLRERVQAGRQVGWLDLCCGSGKALVEAVRMIDAAGLSSKIEVVGVDLVGMFLRPQPDQPYPTLIEASLRRWRPEKRFDLITCVHGLHYLGDKLGVIARAVSWLVEDGRFVANLDLANVKFPGTTKTGRTLASELRRSGLAYDAKRKLASCHGNRSLNLGLRYLGADDRAGPNYTGQPAVNSFYEEVRGADRV